MEYRTLGHSDMKVAPIGMGCWAIGGIWQFLDIQAGWGEVDDAESIRAIQTAFDNGINLFDTAANYGTGHSEHILGQALADKRDKVLIATKFGFDVDEQARLVKRYPHDKDLLVNLHAECEASLRRLNTDYIDLYQLHVWDYPIDAALALLDELEAFVREGKIRTYGWSTDSVKGARAFAEGEHCVAIQHDLKVVMDAPAMLALCEEKNLASLNRTPLACGALTGKYSKETVFPATDVRNDLWAQDAILKPAYNHLDALRDILTSEGRTLAQGALAWILARSEKTIPIPGIRTVKQAQENAQAMQLGPLKPEQMQEINDILSQLNLQETSE
jgi:aryl-alcohol dehydrogenase-like predicted oxidoreductase